MFLDPTTALQSAGHEPAKAGPNQPGRPSRQDIGRVMYPHMNTTATNNPRQEEGQRQEVDLERTPGNHPCQHRSEGQIDDGRRFIMVRFSPGFHAIYGTKLLAQFLMLVWTNRRDKQGNLGALLVAPLLGGFLPQKPAWFINGDRHLAGVHFLRPNRYSARSQSPFLNQAQEPHGFMNGNPVLACASGSYGIRGTRLFLRMHEPRPMVPGWDNKAATR